MNAAMGIWTKVIVVLFVMGAALGCRKTEKFPIEPKLTFKSFELFGDSASLTVSFTDGDGDIGLDDSDDQPPFDSASYYSKNFFIEHYIMTNGEWQLHTFSLPLYYRIERITPNGQNKTLEGDISVAMEGFVGGYVATGADSVRYSVKIVDRALHESNIVYTNLIVVD